MRKLIKNMNLSMMNLKIIRLSIFLASISFGASCYSKVLTVYYCNNFSDAESCSANCSNAPKNLKFDARYEQKLEFLINEKLNSVMMKTYFGGKFNDSRILKNCNIFNENNWDCSEKPIWVEKSKWFVHEEVKMNNGFYVYGMYTSKESKSNSSSATCAK